jgi:hypothetical protein
VHPRRFIVARLVFASLLLGMLLTVLSAWCCAALSPFPLTTIEHLPNETDAGPPFPIPSRVPDDWELGCRVWSQSTGMRYQFITEGVWFGSTLGALSGRKNRSMEWVELGWPIRSMEYTGSMDDGYPPRNGKFGTVEHRLADGILIGGKTTWVMRYEERRLPLMPLWPGFAFSTCAYGVLSLLAITGIAALRRARRRVRGLCVACVYPLGAAARCSECGTPR